MTSGFDSLAAAAESSPWVQAEPGLAEAVGTWETTSGPARGRLSDTAVNIARPGGFAPARALRHATAVGLSRMIRVPARLPGDLRDLTPLRDTDRWARETGAEAFADQLALGGAATAEVARLIVSARGLFPTDLVDELTRRPIEPPALRAATAERVVGRTFEDVRELRFPPLASLPTSQLHDARLRVPDGADRAVAVRVRRPGVARQVVDDARITASMVAPMSQLLPQVGGMGPLGFVQLTTRQGLEAVDLRYEALNLIEFGLIAEAAGIEGLGIARPLPGFADQRVLVIERPDGVSATAGRADPDTVVRAIIGLTLEPALTHGVFWADPCAEHLLVTSDGALVVVGIGSAGHLSATFRAAGIRFLASIVSGDTDGQIDAMRMAGAVPPDVDLDSLAEDLASAESLKVSTILLGGEAGLLNGLRDATRILLAHQLTPPLDVILLLRTVFAVGDAVERLAPGSGGLMAGLFPLFQRLPDLLASAELDAHDAPTDSDGNSNPA